MKNVMMPPRGYRDKAVTGVPRSEGRYFVRLPGFLKTDCEWSCLAVLSRKPVVQASRGSAEAPQGCGVSSEDLLSVLPREKGNLFTDQVNLFV